MNFPETPWKGLLALALLGPSLGMAQGTELLAHDAAELAEGELVDMRATVDAYEPLNHHLGGDSIRHCNGYACIGWVEDHYADGTLKHRGYYDDGRLIIYRNHYPDGTLEREFKVLDNVRCLMRTYHANGTLLSEAKYHDGRVVSYTDHYASGRVRYEEERHKTEPYFLKMNLYAQDGTPISTFELEDKKRLQFRQREFHPDGSLRSDGLVAYDPVRMDSQRIGTWRYYDPAGSVTGEEDYVDGKVHVARGE